MTTEADHAAFLSPFDFDTPEGAEGWVTLPIRWTVERTFAWLGKCRRLGLDREKTTRSAEAMIRLAMIQLMLNRLCPKDGDPEFRYRKAS